MNDVMIDCNVYRPLPLPSYLHNYYTGQFIPGSLRLVGNSGQTGGSSGRLEVYYNGQLWLK